MSKSHDGGVYFGRWPEEMVPSMPKGLWVSFIMKTRDVFVGVVTDSLTHTHTHTHTHTQTDYHNYPSLTTEYHGHIHVQVQLKVS